MRRVLSQYANDPAKYPLDEGVIEQFIKSNDERARKELNFSEITNTADENLYHVAARQQNIRAIKILNRLIPKEDRQQLLSMQRDVTSFQRFRATLSGQSAQCLTPFHLAVMKWREKNGNDAVFYALLEGLHGPLATVEALTARDEKCRTVLGLVADSKIRQQKKDDMTERISGKLSESRKEIQGTCEWLLTMVFYILKIILNAMLFSVPPLRLGNQVDHLTQLSSLHGPSHYCKLQLKNPNYVIPYIKNVQQH